MTHDQKIDYMKIAAGICDYGFEREGLDLLVSLYELILEEKGKANIETVLGVKHKVEERENVKKRQELLDKVSEKVK